MVLFLLSLCLGIAVALNCLNSHGESVGWWAILKLPKGADSPLEGEAFAYIDSGTPTPVLSTTSINDKSSALAMTIESLNTKGCSSYVLYR